MSNFQSILRSMTEFLWPPRCVACGEPVASHNENHPDLFCRVCAGSLTPIESPRCPLCAIPFQSAGNDRRCGHCIQDPPLFIRGDAAYEYGGALVEAVRRWKYRGLPWLGRGLAHALCDRLEGPLSRLEENTVVVPVPSHRERLKARGFNQAAILAATVARFSRSPLDTRSLKRKGDVAPQASLSREKRLVHMKGAFYTSTDSLRGRPILLVDDIVTTTATVRAASEALIDAGATSVSFISLARTT